MPARRRGNAVMLLSFSSIYSGLALGVRSIAIDETVILMTPPVYPY